LPQLYLAPSLHLPQIGVTQPLELNLGMKFGENGSDVNYPSGSGTLGEGALYCFTLTNNVTNRNVTLTQTQDVRLRMGTKSNTISFQLRDMDGNAVGNRVNSLGNANGDDIIRNVPPGEYYIEASRTNYISGCTMPFGVDSTRVILRNNVTTNTIDLQATSSGQTLSGTVVDALSGEALQGVKIVSLPYNSTYGAGVPVYTGTTGSFSYLTVNAARDLVFSKEGYKTAKVYRAAGAASGLRIELQPVVLVEHTVTFVDWDGSVIDVQTVPQGYDAKAPADPARKGYDFSGWDVDFSKVMEDIIVTAKYDRILITSIAIDAPALVTIPRGAIYRFSVILNAGALDDTIVWLVSSQAFAVVHSDGLVTIMNKTGTVLLTATDPDSGLSSSVILRIV
jgi:hypothetical protein